ncbi:MAG: copper homeostasis periplasmic binding protein CopC [Rhizobiaceae bacterium]
MRNFLAAFAIPALILAAPLPAWAHAHLQTASPSADGRVKISPSEITLHFSEDVEPHFSKIALATADGKALKLERPTTAPNDHKTLISKVPEKLSAGTYRVTWHAVSVDTHKTQGSFTFTVAP